MKWTKDQENAIHCSGGTVLVSAGAGSGKTAILVERIITKIINECNNTDIDQLLIVTFSSAAAHEIKDRISKKLDSLLMENPNNKHLQRQQLLIDSANISTIHSFCQKLIRENFESLSISADFKIGQETQVNIIKYDAFTEIIDDFYLKDDFSLLLELTGSTHNSNRFFDIFCNILEFLQSLPFPSDWLNKNLLMYDTYSNSNINIAESLAAQSIFKYAKKNITHAAKIIEKCKELTMNQENTDLYHYNLNQKLTYLESLINSTNSNNWNSTFNILNNFELIPLPRAKKNMDTCLKESLKTLYDQFKCIIANLKDNYFSGSNDDFISDMNYTKKILKILIDIINKFYKKFTEMKRSKNILDFSDLEHLTIELLLDYDGELCKKTKLAESISKNFKEIFIDEYQDINLTQEYIFKAISVEESNLFMVGDSKQSIYRFRQAMPELFIQKSNKYPLHNNITYPSKIVLGHNFRSRKSVTEFINYVFAQLMSEEIGEIEYTSNQFLTPATEYPGVENSQPEIYILKKNTNLTKEERIYEEAKYIAFIIKKMVDNNHQITKDNKLQNATYGDFCILLRSPNNKIQFFIKAFKELNIPIYAENATNFFETKEISTMLSLLKIINNPLNDIDMLSIIFSEISSFVPDDLIRLKSNYNEDTLFFTVRAAAKDNDPKSLELYNLIEYFIKISNLIPINNLIKLIYDKTDFYNIVGISPNGYSRQFNLDLLENIAYESIDLEICSLIEFISYLENLSKQKSVFKINEVNEYVNENSVKIMSIHKSKGLEFPICIISDMQQQINRIDIKSSILLHPDIGVGIDCIDVNNNIRFSTIPKDSIKLEIEKNMLSEELRILYVAMTRAKEKLIMIISDNSYQTKLSKWNTIINLDSKFNAKLSPFIVNQAKSYEDFLLLSILRHPEFNNKKSSIFQQEFLNPPDIKIIFAHSNDLINISSSKNIKEALTNSINKQEDINNISLMIKKRINFSYPLNNIKTIPSKLSVSDIAKKDLVNEYAFEKRPKIFYKDGLTNIEKGNLIHKFMQLANYENAMVSVESECKRLLNLEFISKEEYHNLDRLKLEIFFKSDLYKLITSSNKLHREFRFVYPIPASELGYTNEDTNITIQGVADCIIENKNEVIIIDYKTDKINFAKELYDRYKIQLHIYEYSLSHIFHAKSAQSILYSFYLGKPYYIKNNFQS